MEAMASSLRPGVAYVVVLTKADKKDGKVSPTVTQARVVCLCLYTQGKCVCVDLFACRCFRQSVCL